MDYIDIAIEEARLALNEGEIPIGAVIVKDNKILAKAHNKKEGLKNPIAHAEILAIEEACREIGDWRLDKAEIYVTLEPCAMCISAIVQSRISRLHIGMFNKDMGACGSVIDLANNRYLGTFIDVKWLYDKRCGDLLKEFFNTRRKENKRI